MSRIMSCVDDDVVYEKLQSELDQLNECDDMSVIREHVIEINLVLSYYEQ